MSDAPKKFTLDARPVAPFTEENLKRQREAWEWEHEIMDGSGLTLRESARALAAELELTPRQTELLVSELRNALVPVQMKAPTRGVARILAIAEELARRQGSM